MIDIEGRLGGGPVVEPRMAKGVPSGPPDGPGRGSLSTGHLAFLAKLRGLER